VVVSDSYLEVSHDTFSLNSHTYRKIPDPEPDNFEVLSTSVAYPYSYPNSAYTTYFINKFQLVKAEKFSTKKFQFFSSCYLLSATTELPMALPSVWPWGVFYIYPPASFLQSFSLGFPHTRAPPVPFRNTRGKVCRSRGLRPRLSCYQLAHLMGNLRKKP